MQIHVGKRTAPNPALCQWTHHASGVDLRCDDGIVPLEDACADHLIERAARRRFAARDVTTQLGEQTPA